MPRCENCDTHVSDTFARVMGDNDGKVWHCPDCSIAAIGEMAGQRNPTKKK